MNFDFTVIGAGIVGLATAYKLTLAWPDSSVVVLEKENDIAMHQSGRNSGVIHSGIYYKPGSHRAKNCIAGRRELVEFCNVNNIRHSICGKIIVAVSPDEFGRLDLICKRGLENNIEGVRIIDENEIRELEPHSAGIRAIHVPCAGIVDFTGVCRELADRIEQAGGEIRLGCKADEITRKNGTIQLRAGDDPIETGFLVGCAGLYSDHVARAAGHRPSVQIVPFRGEYYELTEEAEPLVRGLIYPLPNPEFPFLGVHFTRMAIGGVECGPNAVFAFRREGYNKLSFDLKEAVETMKFSGFRKLATQHWRMGLEEYHRSFSKQAFLRELQKLVPEVRREHLRPAPAGVRAMALTAGGEILDDFYFEESEREIHVLNAPSPAATAALSIADEIVGRIQASVR